MNKFLDKLKSIKTKQDVDISSDIFLRHLARTGITGLSLREVQQIGQVTDVFFRYYQNVFPDELKLNVIQKKVVKLFKSHIADELSDEMTKVLISFPIEIIEALKKQRDTLGLSALIDIKNMENIGKEFSAKAKSIIYKSMFSDQRKQTDADETLQLMREKLSSENLDAITLKLKEFMKQYNGDIYPKTTKALKGMEENLERIDLEIERVMREGGPEIRPGSFQT